jgi:hypothetical protein
MLRVIRCLDFIEQGQQQLVRPGISDLAARGSFFRLALVFRDQLLNLCLR